jgi:sugar phosphate isomerase/epimerase
MSDKLPNKADSDGEASADSLGALTAARVVPAGATAKRAVRVQCGPMPLDSRRIALQLWTLREHLKTADDVARTFARVREIGYEHVQLSGLGALPAAEVKRLADAADLEICATHEDAREIIEQPNKVADTLSTLGCRFTAYPYPHVPLDTLDQVFALCDGLTAAGEVLRSRGQLLTYHNHAIEFRKLGGKAILDWIYERTDPVMLHGELDTYWVQAGGGDPAGYCARLSGRLPLLHLKDYAIDAKNEPVMAALGEGNLSFPTILREADAAGCEWYIVEQDRGFTDPFAAIATSLRYLKSL